MRGGGWAGIVLGVISLGLALYQWKVGSDKAAESERKNEKQMRKQEWKAQIMNLKQLNQALARGMGGVVATERKLLEAQRARDYGTPEKV